MRSITIHLPDALDMDDNEIATSLAAILYEDGKLSLGQAAELVGLSKRIFMQQLGKHGVSIFNQSAAELSTDVHNA